MTRTEHGPDDSTAALLRAALLDDLEAVMSATDTERELRRFQSGLARRDRRRHVLAAAAAAVAAVAAVGAFLVVRGGDEGPSVAASSSDEVSGEISFVIGGGRELADGRSGQVEYRDAVWNGDLLLDVGRPLRGTLRLQVGAAGVPTGNGLVVGHLWGTAEAELDGQRCVGTVGMSYYADPAENGGALQLTCADGSVLGLSMEMTDHGPRGGSDWGADVTVDSGFYRAG